MRKLTLILLIVLIFSSSGLQAAKNRWEVQLKKYAQIYSIIKDNHPGKLDEEKMVFASIVGLLKTLDPHSYFLDPLALRSMNEDQQGNYFGIGIRITRYEDRLTVVAPLKDTPAYKLGLLPGDVIAEIEGKETKGMTLDDAMSKLRGAKGTYVHIKIQREGVDELIPFKIKRAEIPLNSISYFMRHPEDPRIAFVNIRTFGRTTANEFIEGMTRLQEEGEVKGLILDLRGNNGGSLYAAVDISDFFLKRGKLIVSVKGRKFKQEFVAKENQQYEDLPLTILIDRGSASASEIVASALQFHKKAVIIGSRSWGKGLVETVHQLPLNSALALTTGKYYTPDDRCLQRDFTELDEYYFFLSNKQYDTDKTIEGGVLPDQLVKNELYPVLIVNFISKGTFFKFARELIKQERKIDLNFKASRKILKLFKKFLKAEKIEYEEKAFKEHIKLIRYEIEREVLSGKFSTDEGVKVFLKTDPVVKSALNTLQKQIIEE